MTNDEAVTEDDRRRAPREEVQLALEVADSRASARTGEENSGDEVGRGRTRNISESGICFLSSMRLRPGSIRVRETGDSATSHTDVELEIVRCRKVSDRLWEYGAAICSGDDATEYELPSREFNSLSSAIQGRRDSKAESRPSNGETSHSDYAQARELVLSLREVANWQTDLQRFSKDSQRQRRSLATAKAVVMFTAVFVIAQSVWEGPAAIWWGPALGVAVILIYASEWQLSRRMHRLRNWSPTRQSGATCGTSGETAGESATAAATA